MKRATYILLLALLVLQACTKSAEVTIPAINISQKSFDVAAATESVTLTITSNCDWKAFNPSCVIVPSSGEAGSTEVTVTFGKATTTLASTYVVDVTSWDGEIEKYFVIRQEGAESRLEIDREQVELEYDETKVICKVSSNCVWKVKTDEGCVSSVPMGEGDAELTVTVPENLTPSEKSYDVVFEANGLAVTLKISQKAPSVLTYAGEQYRICALKDGNVWMAENLRYLPDGVTPCKATNNVKGGVYYPVVVPDGKTAAEFSDDPQIIKARGYLYQSEVALGCKVGDITTEQQIKELEGARGICPEGWHIPTYDDINNLIGYMNASTNTAAPYYDGSKKNVASLNADGFNLEAAGAISISDVTKTSVAFTGALAAFPGRISSGFYAGSSLYKTSYIEDSTEIKNIQLWGVLLMTNKNDEAEFTSNGAYVGFRMGVSVRCVRDRK